MFSQSIRRCHFNFPVTHRSINFSIFGTGCSVVRHMSVIISDQEQLEEFLAMIKSADKASKTLQVPRKSIRLRKQRKEMKSKQLVDGD
jgi:hypothetical protein